MKPPVMIVAVGIVVPIITDACLQVVLVERDIPPHEGKQALPGDLVLPKGSVMDAARRELVEEAGLGLDATRLEQLATFGKPGRDPRGRVISATHLALAASLSSLTPGLDAPGARQYPVDDLPFLAFDHDEILRTGIEQVRAKLEYMTVATRFCRLGFTMTELRQIYEAVWGVEVDPRNFSRKVLGSRGFVVECGTRNGGCGRPTTLYRAGTTDGLHPPIMREG